MKITLQGGEQQGPCVHQHDHLALTEVAPHQTQMAPHSATVPSDPTARPKKHPAETPACVCVCVLGTEKAGILK